MRPRLTLTKTSSTSLPEPVIGSAVPNAHPSPEGWACLLHGASGALYTLRFHESDADIARTGLVVPPLPPDKELLLETDRALTRAAVHNGPMRGLYDLASGERLALLPRGAAALGPDGRWCLGISEKGIGVHYLAGEVVNWETAWNEVLQRRVLASPDAVMTEPPDYIHDVHLDSPSSCAVWERSPETWWAAIGCYGFLIIQQLDVSEDAPNLIGEGGILCSDVVYDPVEVIPPGAGRLLLGRHGYGCGLVAIDTEAVRHWQFPRGVMEKDWYGNLWGATAAVDGDDVWVNTRDGDCLWTPPTGEVRWSPQRLNALALRDGALVVLDDGGRALSWWRYAG